MCATCGCGDHHHDHHDHDHHDHDHHHSHSHRVQVEIDVLAKNKRFAEENRRAWANRRVVNLMSAPGAGKTTLVERTVRHLAGVAVIEGDQETTIDAERVQAAGAEVVQLNTGAACHLDAQRVGEAARVLRGRMLLIENVGNLVCPAAFDLGENARAVMISVTEGEDKPLKYAPMFRAADVVLVNKIDLAEAVGFDRELCLANVRRVNARARIMAISARRGDGLDEWCAWLERG
jgi:hydrogenase nickel incorporation protein HypB